MRKVLGVATATLLLSLSSSSAKEWVNLPEIHGGVVLYYQGAHFTPSPSGTGYVADFEISFKPTKKGEFYMRLHAGEGS